MASLRVGSDSRLAGLHLPRGGGTRESAEVMRLDAEPDAGPGLLSEHLQDAVAGCAENLNAHGGLQGLRIRPRGALADHMHVELHRGRIRVNLDDPNLGSILVDVLVERDQTGFVYFVKAERPGTRF